jgi:MFS family permease
VNRNFILLMQGQIVSNLGTHLFVIVTLYWLMEASNSGSLMGLYMMVESLPAALLMPLGGVIADRVSRKKIIVLCDLFNGVAVLILAALFFLGAPTQVITVALFITAGFLGVTLGLFEPAVLSMLPDIMPSKSLALGNSLIGITFNLSEIVGKAVGGALFLAVGAPLLVLLGLRNYLLLEFGIAFCIGLMAINLPFFVRDFLLKDADWYGYLMAALAVGGVFGSLVAGARFNKKGLFGRKALINISLLYFPVGCFLFALVRNEYQTLLLFFIFGATLSQVGISGMTLVQTAAKPEMRGRVMASFTTVIAAAFPASTLLGGVLADLLDKNIPLVIALAGLIGIFWLYSLLSSRALQEFITVDETAPDSF